MRKRTRLLERVAGAVLALIPALAFNVRAEEWSFHGARYQAMGGGGVPVVDDGDAV